MRDKDSDDCSIATSVCTSLPDDVHNDLNDSIVDHGEATINNERVNLGGEDGDLTLVDPIDFGLQNLADIDDRPTPRTGCSIADHLMDKKEVCLLSFDLEHCGEYGGIVQLSAEMSRVQLQPT